MEQDRIAVEKVPERIVYDVMYPNHLSFQALERVVRREEMESKASVNEVNNGLMYKANKQSVRTSLIVY